MIAGVVLLQLVTGNLLARLVLGSVGAIKFEGEPQRRTSSRVAGCWARWNGCWILALGGLALAR